MHMIPDSSSISHWPVGCQRGQYNKWQIIIMEIHKGIVDIDN